MPRRVAIGVDLGGTKILAGVVDEDGKVGERLHRPTPTESSTALVAALAEAVDELRSPDVAAVGFGIPGRIDRRAGLVIGSVNIPLREVRLQEQMQERLGL